MGDSRIITSVFTLIDIHKRFLLQHRTNDAPRSPGYWSFFGGMKKEGEKPEYALLREAKEELGIKLKDYIFFDKYETDGSNQQDHERFMFLGPLSHDVEYLRRNQMEGQGLDMFSFSTIEDLMARSKIKEFDFLVLSDIVNSSIIEREIIPYFIPNIEFLRQQRLVL